MREQFRNWTNPDMTSQQHVRVAPGPLGLVDRTTWQNECSIELNKVINNIEAREFDTFKNGYDGCRLKVAEHVKQIRKHVGPSEGSMSRRQMLAQGRDLAEALLVHLLRRRYSEGHLPCREWTRTELNAEYVRDKGWFHPRRKEVEQDLKKTPLPPWLSKSNSPWHVDPQDRIESSNISRCLRMIEELYSIGSKWKHDTNKDLEPTHQEADVYLQKLRELFSRDDSRPRGKKERILV